jgi:hypothetical protein
VRVRGADRRWPAITPRQRRRRQLWCEIRRVAQDDLDQVAVSIAALEPAVSADGGPARDAYYAAVGLHADAEERLAVARSIADVRKVACVAAHARHQIACAQSWLEERHPSGESGACFFDPAHGPSQRTVVFAPDGGKMQQLRACSACAEEVDAGRAPPSRKVILDGRPQPYWRSPIHAGYFGSRGDSLDDLLSLSAGSLGGGEGIGLLDWLDDLLDPVDRV